MNSGNERSLLFGNPGKRESIFWYLGIWLILSVGAYWLYGGFRCYDGEITKKWTESNSRGRYVDFYVELVTGKKHQVEQEVFQNTKVGDLIKKECVKPITWINGESRFVDAPLGGTAVLSIPLLILFIWLWKQGFYEWFRKLTE